MTTDEHNKILGTLYFIYGAMHGLTLVALLLLVLVIRLAALGTNSISSFWIVVGISIFVLLLLTVGVLPLVVGYGFRKRQRWARTVGVPVAVISLVNIPVGTALGIYTIKFFRSEGGIGLYGGKLSTVTDSDLQEALEGAQPLMNWADRLK
jgi:hypothetical protein